MDLSVVVSTYNRDDKIFETLNRLFESDLHGFGSVELLIIDDGSPRPVKDVLPRLNKIPSKMEIRLLTQENSGIGATRNRGFREARSSIVLFLDDDILVKNETLREMCAAQRTLPGSVIFGSYPFVSHDSESLSLFSRQLYGYEQTAEEPVYEKVEEMISGLLVVDKAKLNGMDGLYKDDMTIPAAEEYEAIYRFGKLGIPLIRARHITATHNHHLELNWLVQQQYKYGLGTAEAFGKHPEIVELTRFAELKANLDSIGNFDVKNLSKLTLASRAGRTFLLIVARGLEKLLPNRNHDFIFGILASAYYWGGFRKGQKSS